MSSTSRNQIRKLELASAVEAVSAALATWLDDWAARDKELARHKTRLDALRSLFEESLKTIGDGVDALDPSRPLEEFYENARDYDQAILWLRRLWDYSRAKLDQRLGQER